MPTRPKGGRTHPGVAATSVSTALLCAVLTATATPARPDDAPKDPASRHVYHTGGVHPQSFYFSGYPLDPPDAPIVSQN